RAAPRAPRARAPPAPRAGRLGARCRKAARGGRVVRPAPARAPPAGLGDPPLRPVLAAPGPRLRAPRDALAIREWRLRRRNRAGHHGAAAPGAEVLSRRAHL